jgi:hypothetical protein
VDGGHVGGPIVIPNAIQVVFNWSLPGGKTGHNVLYGVTPGVPAPTVAMADGLFGTINSSGTYNAMNAFLPPAVSFTGITLRSVHTANLGTFTSVGAAKAGASTTLIAMPNEVAICVSLKTGKTGPSNRGRMYLMGWDTTSVIAGNVIAPALVTAIQNWANTLIAGFSGQGMTLSIGQPARAQYTGSTGTLHPARAAGSTPVTSLLVRNNTFDSQRRRGLK